MKWFFSKKQTDRQPFLFVHGDDSSIGRLHESASHFAFDEWMGESQETPLGESRQFLGVSLRPSRLRLAAIAGLCVLGIFVAKAAHLQIVQGGSYRQVADGNRTHIQFIPSLRGVIYDRNHTPLAENAPSFRLTAIVNDLPQGSALTDLWQRVATITGVSVAELLSHAAVDKDLADQPVVLLDSLTYEQALSLMLKKENYPGLTVEASTERQYITTKIPTLSHLLGYTGRINQDEFQSLKNKGYRMIDEIGKGGVEKTYESVLRGTFGREVAEVDHLGHEQSIITKEDPVNGDDLVLSIDANLTAEIEQVLKEKIGPAGRAAVVMVNPQNGEVLALVSTPSFDSNSFTGGIDQATYQALLNDPNHPLFDRTIASELPSGSTFKPVVAAGALQEGLITRDTTVLSVGGLQVGPYFFKDWKVGGHGITNVTRALAESINTFFYYIGGGYKDFVGLGVEKIDAYGAKFGFGSPLGIDLPGEAGGLLPTKEWKEKTKGDRWYIGDTYNLAIGQGDLLVTPLQIDMMTATVANGGTVYKPHVVHSLLGKDGEQLVSPTVVNPQVVDKANIEIVRQGMRQTVTAGSARSLQSLPVAAAGKTGTAQWSSTRPTHAWFTGFAPYDDPQVAITVFVEEGGGGDVIAVPIAREILQWWFTQYNVDSTK